MPLLTRTQYAAYSLVLSPKNINVLYICGELCIDSSIKQLYSRLTILLFNKVVKLFLIAAGNAIPEGKHTLVLDFAYDGGGVGKGATATLLVDGNEVAKGRIDETVPTRYSMTEGLEVGRDAGMPVSKDYRVPFIFTGEIGRVIVKLL